MEIGGLPMLNCLLQHTLRNCCSCSSDSAQSSAKWVYAVFWRILPRNFPPTKWEYGGCMLDRSKGNNRNWILVWEDGYCDFHNCERAGHGYANGRFGADVFFKMSHEVYNYGEGLVGKAASEKGHKWVFLDSQSENEANILSAWNVSPDLQPRAWEVQFNSGIQTIALVSVREGVIQLGSLNKVAEDPNLVASIQRKFSYLQSLPGILETQRPHLPIQHLEPNILSAGLRGNVKQSLGRKRPYDHLPKAQPLHKSFNLGWNSPHDGRRLLPVLPIPPLYPYGETCDLGHKRGVSSYVNVSKIQKTNIGRLISAQEHELELKPASSAELQEPRELQLRQSGSGLNHAAGLELEIRMMKNHEARL